VNDYDVARGAADHYEPVNFYNAHGAPEGESGEEPDAGVRTRRAEEAPQRGEAQGEFANGRADRPTRMPGGYSGPPRSPYSQGHQLESPIGSRSHRGHEGDGPGAGHEGFDDA
jgi:hypothetical protein